jgi:hypothetical protein
MTTNKTTITNLNLNLMKKFTLFILLTCLPLISFAQDSYENLVVEGKTWTTVFDNLNPSAFTQYKYYLKGDTVIDNTHCTKMYKAEGNDAAQYIGAMREDGKKVYIYRRGNTEAKLLYDFSLKVGDSFVGSTGVKSTVTSIGTATFKDKLLKKINLLETENESDKYEWSILEGVGGFGDPSYSGPDYPGNYECLLTCQGNNGTLYYNDDYNHGPQFVKEGKTWNTLYLENICVYTFKGDTTFNDTIYKKMYRDGVYVYSARQQGMKVYWRAGDKDNEELAINFGLKEGDYFDVGEEPILKVGKVDTVTANGVNYRRLQILYYDKFINEYVKAATWVDGIGVGAEPLNPLEGFVIDPGYLPVSCYDNGVKIFSWNDFVSPAGTDGIENAIKPNNNNNDESIYDLSGRKLNAKPEKGLYIKGGKVFVVK